MKFLYFAAASLVLATALVQTAPADQDPGNDYTDVPYEACAANELITIKKVQMKNFPPRITDKQIDIHTLGSCTKDILPGAYMIATANLGVLEVARVKYDLCAEIKKGGVDCPLKANKDLDLSMVTDMPPGISVPPGVTINLKSQAYNADNTPLFCVATKMKFRV